MSTRYDYRIPTLALVSGFIIFALLLSAFSVFLKNIIDKRRANKLGARLSPKVTGESFGNIDVLRDLRKNWDVGYPADGFREICEAQGPVVNMWVLWADLVFTTSPENIKKILATDFNNYVKGRRVHEMMSTVLGSGIFNEDGDMWKFHRSMTRPFFTRDRISDFELFDRHTDTAISIIRDRMSSGHSIDLQDLMSRFTLDSATEFLFGHCVHSLVAHLPYPHNARHGSPESTTPNSVHANNFARAFSEVQEVIASRARYGWTWPLTEILGDKTKEPMKIVRAYIDPIIQAALAKKKAAPKVSEDDKQPNSQVEDGETLLDHLVQLSSDPVVLRDETLNILIAGRDTTAATLTFALYFLAMHPKVLERLREEIFAKVGPSRRPDYDDIKDMKYLRAVINETLRLFPVVPFNMREVVDATTWTSPDPSEKPMYIPGGTMIVYSIFLMQRRKDLWGPDAEEFDPDRFIDHRLKTYLIKNPSIFLPFNGGPRICLGQQFAYNEISFMLIRLCQQFSSIFLDETAFPQGTRPPGNWASGVGRKATERVWPKLHLTMYVNGGLWVKMQDAENS